MKVNVSLIGVNTVVQNLRTVKKDKVKALSRGLKKAARFLLAESQKIVPVDTGALRRSGFVRMRWEGTRRSEVVVGYVMDYAIWVHERLDLRHAPGKSAKFLEIPARRFAKRMRDIIAAEISGMSKRELAKFGPSSQ